MKAILVLALLGQFQIVPHPRSQFDVVPHPTQDTRDVIIGFTLGDGCVPCKRADADSKAGKISRRIDWRQPPEWYIHDYVERGDSKYGFPAFWFQRDGKWWVHSGYTGPEEFERMLNPPIPSAQIAKKPAKTAVCQCGGSNRGVCYCLQRGIACKCRPGVGSVWNLDANNRPVDKTGQYANPTDSSIVSQPARSGKWEWRRYCTKRGCYYQQVWVE